jgi:hypothetical protein
MLKFQKYFSQSKGFFVKENEISFEIFRNNLFAKMESSKLNNYSAESWRTCHSTMVANTKYYSFKPNQTQPNPTQPKLRGLGFFRICQNPLLSQNLNGFFSVLFFLAFWGVLSNSA